MRELKTFETTGGDVTPCSMTSLVSPCQQNYMVMAIYPAEVVTSSVNDKMEYGKTYFQLEILCTFTSGSVKVRLSVVE